MDLIVLNKKFENIVVIDSYNSSIWTDKFFEFGDFELYIPASSKFFSFLKKDYYLTRNDSEHVMIILNIQIISNAEEGDQAIITGESLESILKRRILWDKVTFEEKNIQDAIKELINSSIISPKLTERKIENFIFEDSNDETILSIKINGQYNVGDNLYDVIVDICTKEKIGYKITLDKNNNFVFKLYKGKDRSYKQIENPFVIFSPEYDNIITSDYKEITKDYKNVALVIGEGDENNYTSIVVGETTGLDRREYYSDARDISKSQNGETISEEKYKELLKERGKEDLNKNKEEITFEGQAETTKMYVYNEDFFMGDIVQISDNYGHDGEAYIREIIFSEDQEGVSVYPTFEMIKEESEEE